MVNFREFNTRLAAMSGMRRVTSTMKMVAASHLHRSQNEMRLPEPFAAELRKMAIVARQIPTLPQHRLFQEPPKSGSRVLVMVMCSDRGLCGAFNSTVIREVRRWVKEQRATRDVQIETLYVGQKGFTGLRQELPPCTKPFTVHVHPQSRDTLPISSYAINHFMDGRYDEVWIIGSRFVSIMKHDAEAYRILPYHLKQPVPKTVPGVDKVPLIEPMDARMLEGIMRLWVHYSVFVAQLNRSASEQASRVLAMENATVNLHRMEKDLALQRNRARQAAITNELTEIVSGAEIV